MRANKETLSWATKVDQNIMLHLSIIMTRKVNPATEKLEIEALKMVISLDFVKEQREPIKEFIKAHKEHMTK